MANDKSSQETVAAMATEIRHLQEVIDKFKAIQVDPTEYAYLKGIILFRSSKLFMLIYCFLFCQRKSTTYSLYV